MSRSRFAGPLLAFATLALAGAAPAELPPDPALADAPPSTAASDFERMLDELGRKEAALVQEQGGIDPELELIRVRTVARGRAYYRLVRAGLLPVGGGFDALVDHAAKVERTRQALERDLAKEKALLHRQAQLSEKLGRLRAERAPLEVQREAMLHARTMIVEAEERRRAFDRAFASSGRPSDHVAIYGAEVGPMDSDPRLGFAALRGRLPMPIAGRAEVRRVSYLGGPGLELEAPGGASVRSVAAGRVVFSDRNEGYGLAVILDHGDDYFSIYGQLGATDAVVGATIAAGARVGVVASQGGRGTLYFELRHEGATIDPGPFLGL
jgi:murein DD-endopeptidase MepM/ murein hydrolase activator NlpD